jgi:hypothetical protein
VQADRIPEISRALSEVCGDQLIQIPASRSEQSDDVCRSVVSMMRDFPSSVFETAAKIPLVFLKLTPVIADRFSGTSDRLQNCPRKQMVNQSISVRFAAAAPGSGNLWSMTSNLIVVRRVVVRQRPGGPSKEFRLK